MSDKLLLGAGFMDSFESVPELSFTPSRVLRDRNRKDLLTKKDSGGFNVDGDSGGGEVGTGVAVVSLEGSLDKTKELDASISEVEMSLSDSMMIEDNSMES